MQWRASQSGGLSEILRSPIPRQKIADALGGMIGQTGKHVGEPGLRVDVVELGGVDEGVDGCGAIAAFIGAGEGLVAASQGDSADFPFGRVVGHAQAAVGEEASERRPALEAVIHGPPSHGVEPSRLYSSNSCRAADSRMAKAALARAAR